MFQVKAKILSNQQTCENYFHLIIEAAKVIKEAKPGNFINIRVSDVYEPLLRRPFSIHRAKGETIEILYEVLGEGTEILSQRKCGEYLDIIGPLGNGFNYPLSAIRYSLSILVAGGMGVAPLIFLAEKLMEVKSQKSKVKIIVLIGAKTKSGILCEKEFKRLGCEVKTATDDGSRGFKGRISELLKQELSAIRYSLSVIYGCGPRPMLKELANISKEYNIPTQVSLEEHLACGIGACMGCVVKTKPETRNQKPDFEYKRVCYDGPVFEASQIIWQENRLR